jgi:protein-tyrosine phosphatase
VTAYQYDILFVCTGNLCRSPLAEGLCKKILEEKGYTDIRVRSAGISALQGREAAAMAIELAEDQDFDISGHRASQISREDLEEADFVLVMEKAQMEFLRTLFGRTEEKIFLLRPFAGRRSLSKDIPDPYGQSREKYESSFDMIDRGVRGFIRTLEDRSLL